MIFIRHNVRVFHCYHLSFNSFTVNGIRCHLYFFVTITAHTYARPGAYTQADLLGFGDVQMIRNAAKNKNKNKNKKCIF